jgi:small-conductance mechanosensitive channel
MGDFLQEKYLRNTVEDYLICLGIIVAGLMVLRIFRTIILKRLHRWAATTETQLDDLAISGLERFLLPMMNFGVIYYAISFLTLNARVEKIINTTMAVVVTYFAIRLLASTLQLMLQQYVKRQENSEEKLKQLRGINLVINIVIWIVGIVFLIDNLGYNVTTIITGLGIGGIAIALAAQNILGDLFNYFVLFFDRPFEIGDFVVVDNKQGHVEHIGIKTTRFKALTGEQLIISNSDLTKSRLHNYKRMDRRRIVVRLGVEYGTPLDKLKQIPVVLERIIRAEPNTTFDRAHMAAFGDFSIQYEMVYYIESSEYNDYMNAQQDINFHIIEEFEKLGVAFAFPTQTIFTKNLS